MSKDRWTLGDILAEKSAVRHGVCGSCNRENVPLNTQDTCFPCTLRKPAPALDALAQQLTDAIVRGGHRVPKDVVEHAVRHPSAPLPPVAGKPKHVDPDADIYVVLLQQVAAGGVTLVPVGKIVARYTLPCAEVSKGLGYRLMYTFSEEPSMSELVEHLQSGRGISSMVTIINVWDLTQ